MFKQLCVSAVVGTRMHRLFAPFYGGHTSILLLHRVRESDRSFEMNRELDVTPGFLDAWLSAAQEGGWRFVSLDYLLDNWDECCRRKKNLVMTLDDGYRDNFQIAWPVFQKHRVPFTLYVTTSFPNRTADLWWYALADLIKSNDAVILDDPQRTVISTQDPHEAFTKLRGLYLSTQTVNQPSFLGSLKERYGTTYHVEKDLITWEELMIMSKDPLCTIGCHTESHANLAGLTEEQASREINDAKIELENRLGRPIVHFAYPYGKRPEASFREMELTQRLRFRSAVTTRIGNLFEGHHAHLHLLPRIPLFEGGWRGRLTDLYQSGMYSALTHSFRHMVTD